MIDTPRVCHSVKFTGHLALYHPSVVILLSFNHLAHLWHHDVPLIVFRSVCFLCGGSSNSRSVSIVSSWGSIREDVKSGVNMYTSFAAPAPQTHLALHWAPVSQISTICSGQRSLIYRVVSLYPSPTRMQIFDLIFRSLKTCVHRTRFYPTKGTWSFS